MFKWKRSCFLFLNGSLLLAIVVLACCLMGTVWGGHARAATQDDADACIAQEAMRLPPMPRREVGVGRVGVHPVSFDDRTHPASARDAWSRQGVESGEWDWLPASPGMDMAETAHDYVLLFSLPGVRDNDIRLTVTDRVVTVEATLRDFRGAAVGGVLRRVQLPRPTIESPPVAAVLSNGLLRVCVGK